MLALAVALAMPPTVDVDVKSGTGLVVRVTGVPVIRGTWFKYAEPDGSRGYYTSTAAAQQIERTSDGYRLAFRSSDGRAFGSQTFTRYGNKLKVSSVLNWSGDRPVKVELAGLLWARIFQGGTLFLDQKLARSLAPTTYADDPAARTYGSGFGEAVFSSAFGRVVVKSPTPSWTLSDARGTDQTWVAGRDLLVLGQPSVELRPRVPFQADLEFDFEPTVSAGKTLARSATASPIAMARLVRQDVPVMLPKPKQALFDRNEPFAIGDELRIDATGIAAPFRKDLIKAIQRSWIAPNLKAPATAADPNVYFRIENIGLPAEGFEIRINRKNVIVWGQDPIGLRHAVQTLATLAFAQNGKLWFPSGTMRDWPSIAWRGVHLFGGPELKTFHQRFAERVLQPLRFNHVVVQCERTNWKSTPDANRPEYNSLEALRDAFAMYRSYDIEPIPLIQSLGHMEWLLQNGKYAELAVNPQVPYTLDVRKPGAKETIEKIWAEAVDLLKPKAIHFGLDEIANRGMSKNPFETNEVWERTLPILAGIATRNGVTPMFWGDMGLSPSQAIDAGHGDDPASSLRRRTALPQGAWIGDWHYKNDPSPERFMFSLNLWKEHNFFPIASGWFNADNIAGFTQAAYRTGSGYLQTTWAGYETTEENVHREMRQFAAYVLAADYAWSGRTDDPRTLDYDPVDVLAKLLYSEPSPLSPAPGTSLDGPRLVRIDDLAFRVGEPLSLLSVLTPGGGELPSEIKLGLKGLKGQTLALALDCAQACEDRDPVADLAIQLEDGRTIRTTLLYGVHVRARADRRDVGAGARGEGLSCLLFPLGGAHEVQSVTLTAASTYAGLRLHGATAY